MKKLALAIASVAILGFAGSALADKGGVPNEGVGNKNCAAFVNPPGEIIEGKNPGQFFKALKALDPPAPTSGENPNELAETAANLSNPTPTVGAFIEHFCGNVP